MPRIINDHADVICKNGAAFSIDPGTILYSAEDREMAKQRYQTTINNEELKRYTRLHGGFSMLRTDKDYLNSLSPATAGRLVYLSTHIDYNNDPKKCCVSKLVVIKNKIKYPIKKSDLNDILRLKKTATQAFFNECSKAGFIEDHGSEGLLLIGPFYKGGGRKSDKKAKLYCNTIQDLYGKLDSKGHKYFGYVAKLIPYINKEWNYVCKNPEEQDIRKIHPFNMKEICSELDLSEKHTNRLKEAWNRAIFDYGGYKQSLCAFVSSNTNYGTQTSIIVNPHLIYSGTNYQNVIGFEPFFRPVS